jgi:hypothetical protein
MRKIYENAPRAVGAGYFTRQLLGQSDFGCLTADEQQFQKICKMSFMLVHFLSHGFGRYQDIILPIYAFGVAHKCILSQF